MAPLTIADGGNAARAVDAAQLPAPRLKVGLFADTRLQPRAIVEAFAGIERSEYAQIVLVATCDAPQRPLHWAWRAWRSVDDRVFGADPDPAEMVDLAAHIPAALRIELPQSGSDAGYAEPWQSQVAQFGPQFGLDVAMVLGDLDPSALCSIARFGAWRLGAGRDDGPLDALDGFREVAEARPVTTAVLTARMATGEERVLCQSWLPTFAFSLTRNRGKLLRRAAQLPARALRDVQRNGLPATRAVAAEVAPAAARACDAPIASRAGGDSRAHLPRIGLSIGRRALQKLAHVDQWFLGYRFDSGDGGWLDDQPFHCVVPPRDRFWADPFPLERDGRYFIFFEELPFATGKGHISVIEAGRDGVVGEPVCALSQSYHLSYPFLLEHDGELFMIPETGENRRVELYRCIEFPHRWRFERALLTDVFCVDPTICRAFGRWWMFVNAANHPADVHDELHLYHAEDLLGPWLPHPANPVKSDARRARPAGALFARNGALFRPAQICVPRYGAGLSINEVLQLSPDAYAEREICRIAADESSGILGMHTLNRAGQLLVTDGFLRRGRLSRAVPRMLAPAHRGPGDDLVARCASTEHAA